METAIDILLIFSGVLCLLIGFAGCFFPLLPSSPLAYCALWLLHATHRCDYSYRFLTLTLIATAVVQLLDSVIPALGAKRFGGSKAGIWGSILGGILGGIFFAPAGLILGPLLGAILGELLIGKGKREALKAGLGAFIGFLAGIVLNVILCTYFAWAFFDTLIKSL